MIVQNHGSKVQNHGSKVQNHGSEVQTLRYFFLTFLARSVSPQGSLRVNSMPVRGVSVGGSNMDASIIRKGSFTWKDCGVRGMEG